MSRAPRGLAAAAVLSLTTVGCVLLPTSAVAAPGDRYTARTSADVLGVTALELPLLPIPAGVELGVGTTDGLTDSNATERSVAEAANLDGRLLGQDTGLLARARSAATQGNPNPGRVDDSSVQVPVPGVLNLQAAEADAQARWAGDGSCLPKGSLLSTSTARVTGLSVLPLPAVSGADLADLGGTTSVTQSTQLVANGQTAAVQAKTTSSAADLSLAGAVDVDVVSAPTLTATASGKPGEAAVIYTPAVLEVTGPEGQTVAVPTDGQSTPIDLPGSPVELRLSSPGLSSVQRSDDGTSAAGESVALRVEAQLAGVTLAAVDVLPMSAAATAPTGGVVCDPPIGPPVDTDNDGLADGEEGTLGTNPNNADSDGDGIKDGTEVVNGTDPLDPADPGPGVPILDTDGDGLTDAQEAALGTDRTKADTDGDGLRDGNEVQLKTDPLEADTDGDGLKDGDEVQRKTDPLEADTDGDGLKDGDEVQRGTDPLKADTDGDGLKDGNEGQRKTNPLKADTDGDRLGDGAEVQRKTNPLKGDTDQDTLTDGQEVNGVQMPGRGLVRTNPTLRDTDRDTLTDGQEVRGIRMTSRLSLKGKKRTVPVGLVRTDPRVRDTDRDTLSDGVEVRGFRNKGKTFRSNPLAVDSDRDGLRDPAEVTGSANRKWRKKPTNPLDWDTDNGGISDGREVQKGSDPTNIRSGPRNPRG